MDLRMSQGWPAVPVQLRVALPAGMPLSLPITHSVVLDDGGSHEHPDNLIAQRDDSKGVEILGIAKCQEVWCDAPGADGTPGLCQKRCKGNEEDDVGRVTVGRGFPTPAGIDLVTFKFEVGTSGGLPTFVGEPIKLTFLFTPPQMPVGLA